MKKLRFTLWIGCLLALVGGFAACNENVGNTEPAKTFMVSLPEPGQYEIFSEISLETAAGVYNGKQIIDPSSVLVTYGENKEEIKIKNDLLTLEKIGDYDITFTFKLPDGNTETYVRKIQSKDTTPPTIVGKFKSRYVQNQGISLNDAMLIVDAYDQNPTTEVEVYYGEKKAENLISIQDGVITPTQIGIYTVVVTSKDDYENTNVQNYSFRVADVHELEYFNGDEVIANVVAPLGGAQLSLTKDTQYVKEGASALKYTHSGSSEAIGFRTVSNVDWTKYTGMEFWVYNPSDKYDYAFDVCSFVEYAGAYSATNGTGVKVRVQCPKGEWTKVEILSDVLLEMTKATESAPNGAPYFSFQILSSYNGGYVDKDGDGKAETPSEQWNAIELYFDEFRYKTDTVITAEKYQHKYFVGDEVTIPAFNVLMVGGDMEYQVKVLKNGAEISYTGNEFTIDTYGEYAFSVTASNGTDSVTKTFPIYVYAEDEFEYVAHEDEFNEIVKGYGGANVTYSMNYTKDGNGSIRYRQAGTTTVFKFLNSPKIDWNKEEGLSFWVYNPSKDYNYQFSLNGYVDLAQQWAGNGNGAGLTYTAFKNSWTKIVVPSERLVAMTKATESAPDGAKYIGVFIVHENNGKSTSAQWAEIDLYFDNFELKCNVEDSLLGSVGSTKILETGFADIQVGTETKNTAWLQTRELYNYPNAVWSASSKLDWKDNKLTMKIYNPANYDYVFQMRAFPVGVPYSSVSTMISETIVLSNVYIGAGQTIDLTIFGDTFDYSAYPYIGWYMDAYNNGGQNSTQFLACNLHFYDMTMIAGSLANESTDYKLSMLTSLNSSSGFINYNKAYVKNGDYSLWWRPAGTWVSSALTFSNEIDWSKVDTLKVHIYNPSRYPATSLATEKGYWIKIGQTATLTSASYAGELLNVKKGWNEYTLDVSTWTTGNYIVLSTAQGTNYGENPFYNGTSATEASTAAWKSLMDNGMYVDFEITYKN